MALRISSAATPSDHSRVTLQARRALPELCRVLQLGLVKCPIELVLRNCLRTSHSILAMPNVLWHLSSRSVLGVEHVHVRLLERGLPILQNPDYPQLIGFCSLSQRAFGSTKAVQAACDSTSGGMGESECAGHGILTECICATYVICPKLGLQCAIAASLATTGWPNQHHAMSNLERIGIVS